MKLSILIPSLIERAEQLYSLVSELEFQAEQSDWVDKIEILSFTDNKVLTIGAKRNELMQRAKGEYVAYIDDDDKVSKNYLELIFKGLETNPDCCSLRGIITWNGESPEIFEHSIKYKEYKTNPPTMGIRYERYPNHLNAIRKHIAKNFLFPEISHGEDTDWATQVFKSGLIKTESYISEVLYHYQYKRK